MKFKYIGAPEKTLGYKIVLDKDDNPVKKEIVAGEKGDGPMELKLYGITFPKGEAVDVTKEAIASGLDVKFVQGKLKNNSHFEHVT